MKRDSEVKSRPSAEPEFDANAPSILEDLDEAFRDVPPESWEKVPLFDPHESNKSSSADNASVID